MIPRFLDNLTVTTIDVSSSMRKQGNVMAAMMMNSFRPEAYSGPWVPVVRLFAGSGATLVSG